MARFTSRRLQNLILNAMENADTWGAAASVNPKDVLSARDLLEDSMDNAFDDELAREKDKNNDRIDQLMVAIEKTRSQIQSSLDAIATLEARNRPQLIPAQRGRIAKAEESGTRRSGSSKVDGAYLRPQRCNFRAYLCHGINHRK